MSRYTLNAGRQIEHDGRPVAIVKGILPYQPVELDLFAHEIVEALNITQALRYHPEEGAPLTEDTIIGALNLSSDDWDAIPDHARALIAVLFRVREQEGNALHLNAQEEAVLLTALSNTATDLERAAERTETPENHRAAFNASAAEYRALAAKVEGII